VVEFTGGDFGQWRQRAGTGRRWGEQGDWRRWASRGLGGDGASREQGGLASLAGDGASGDGVQGLVGKKVGFYFYFIFDIWVFLIMLTSGVFSTSTNTCFL
jgi:hypothetical protein